MIDIETLAKGSESKVATDLSYSQSLPGWRDLPFRIRFCIIQDGRKLITSRVEIHLAQSASSSGRI